MYQHPTPLQVISRQRSVGQSEGDRQLSKLAAYNSIIYISTRALHSFLSFAHCGAASTVILLLPKATFTPSIQQNLGLPHTHPLLSSAINTSLAIRYSSIFYTWPNHLNTHWSILLVNSHSIPALLCTSSFLTLSIRDSQTKLLKHFISRRFTFLLTILLIPLAYAPYNAIGTISPSHRHFSAFIHNTLLIMGLMLSILFIMW